MKSSGDMNTRLSIRSNQLAKCGFVPYPTAPKEGARLL
jgi:hypothetical protein